MKRRQFLLTTAGLIAWSQSSGLWAVENKLSPKKQYKFEVVNPGKTLCPVTRVTPDDGHYVQTYYDVCAFSPSQRYLAVTRLPFQDRMPRLGDLADVCVIDAQEQTIQTVYTTKSWGFQTGANVNWGAVDRHLYTNDVIDGTSVGVLIDLETGETKAFVGPLYHVAPDESCFVGFPHELRDITQLGYGVPSKDPEHPKALPPGAAKDEGIWRTDIKTNQKKLIVSLAAAAAVVPSPIPKDLEGGTFYFWHSKFNVQGTRIIQVLRYMPPGEKGTGANPMTLTFNPDGSNLHYAPLTDRVPVWGNAGGHPNWYPDGENILRNLKPDGGPVRLCQFSYDGKTFKVLSEKLKGGGHPRIEPRNRYIVTDEEARLDGKAGKQIRLIDLSADAEKSVCILPTVDKKDIPDSVFRLDGHPSWSRDYKKISFQALSGKNRQLFVADLTDVIG